MKRDVPEGCSWGAFPAVGWGRVLTGARWCDHVVERYVCLRINGILYLVLFGKYFEQWRIAFARFDPNALRGYDRDVVRQDDDPWAHEAEGAMVSEQERMDASRMRNREIRREQARARAAGEVH